jgi:hypothetical protein
MRVLSMEYRERHYFGWLMAERLAPDRPTSVAVTRDLE